LINHNLTKGTFKMAIIPEIKPRINVSAGSEYDAAPMRGTTAESRQDRQESSSNNSIGYAVGVLAVLLLAYFAFAYYGPNSSLRTVMTESATPAVPPVTPQVIVPETPVVPPVTAPATPVTPPATSTTP
jgi:hypothetical protein